MNLDLEPIIKVFLIILALATVVGIVGICFGIVAIATAVKAYFAGKTAKAKLNPSATFTIADRAPPPFRCKKRSSAKSSAFRFFRGFCRKRIPERKSPTTFTFQKQAHSSCLKHWAENVRIGTVL